MKDSATEQPDSVPPPGAGTGTEQEEQDAGNIRASEHEQLGERVDEQRVQINQPHHSLSKLQFTPSNYRKILIFNFQLQKSDNSLTVEIWQISPLGGFEGGFIFL